MMNISFILWALLLVDGVFGVKKADVSVMEGDSVTLKPSAEIPEDDSAEWWFGDKRIALMNKAVRIFSTSESDDAGFRSRLELDKQTGSLTITNIRTDHTGVYKLKIRSRTVTPDKIFSVTVHGEKMTMSMKEGELIMLPTGLIDIRAYNLILWKFGDSSDVVAEIDEVTNRFLTHYSSDERFKGRLQMHHHFGDLIISDSRSTDSGVYHLDMSSSTHSVQRNISVTVKMSTYDPLYWIMITIVLGLFLIKILIVFFVGIKKS